MVLKPASILKADAAAEHFAALKEARSLAGRLRDELGAISVLLFGSRVRGDWHRGSDCDVIVVSDWFQDRPIADRWMAVYEQWTGPVELDPIAVTPVEFGRARQGTGIIAMALADGVVELLERAEASVARAPAAAQQLPHEAGARDA